MTSKIGEAVNKYLEGFKDALSNPVFAAVGKRLVTGNGVERGRDGPMGPPRSSPESATLMRRLSSSNRSPSWAWTSVLVTCRACPTGVYVAILGVSITFMLVYCSTAANLATIKEWLSNSCEGNADVLSQPEESLGKVSQVAAPPTVAADNANNDKHQNLSGIYWRRATERVVPSTTSAGPDIWCLRNRSCQPGVQTLDG